MKSFKYLSLIALTVFASFTSVACSSDDEEEQTFATPAEAVAGTYVGTVSGNAVETLDNSTLIIKANADGTVTITQPTIQSKGNYNGVNKYAGATVINIPVKEVDGSYTLEGNYQGSNGAMSVRGEVKGELKGKTLSFDYTYDHLGLLEDPLIHFVGTKQ